MSGACVFGSGAWGLQNMFAPIQWGAAAKGIFTALENWLLGAVLHGLHI